MAQSADPLPREPARAVLTDRRARGPALWRRPTGFILARRRACPGCGGRPGLRRGRLSDRARRGTAGQAARVLRTALLDTQLWNGREPLAPIIDTLSDDEGARERVFRSWCETKGGTHSDREAVLRPDDLRTTALQECLRVLARERSLVLLLDTCECLSRRLERSLRALVARCATVARRFSSSWAAAVPRTWGFRPVGTAGRATSEMCAFGLSASTRMSSSTQTRSRRRSPARAGPRPLPKTSRGRLPPSPRAFPWPCACSSTCMSATTASWMRSREVKWMPPSIGVAGPRRW